MSQQTTPSGKPGPAPIRLGRSGWTILILFFLAMAAALLPALTGGLRQPLRDQVQLIGLNVAALAVAVLFLFLAIARWREAGSFAAGWGTIVRSLLIMAFAIGLIARFDLKLLHDSDCAGAGGPHRADCPSPATPSQGRRR